MIARIIQWSMQNRIWVLLISVVVTLFGIYALKHTPVDAIPDLSDVQVIIKTSYPGQAPQVVEDQITYPLSTALLAVPGATTVRSFSFFGDSYVYVVFDEGIDPYWARSRVLEYLNQVAGQLPPEARPELGPDATGVGWVYMYALTDDTGQHDLAQLRSLQDWHLKYELQAIPGVSEVATVGGMVRQYQISLDPNHLRQYNLTLTQVKTAITQANQEAGGSVVEMAEAEYMVRATGYLQSIADIESIPLGVNQQGTPIFLSDIANIQIGPEMRRGLAELNGQGEVVGGIIVMRQGENALQVIQTVKQKLADLQQNLPSGVEIVETYDRSSLIQRAIDNLKSKLIEELIIVTLIALLFLYHFRSSLIIVISLPIGILIAFIIMYIQGVNANIMSLGGIAIAIGAMVDGAIVMIERVHKALEEQPPKNHKERWHLIQQASTEVGPPIFFSLLIITLSFMPVFALQAQEGRLFSPLAFTKTYAMAASAILAITLVPVLMGYLIRGKIMPEHQNPVNRLLIASYRPLLRTVLNYPKATILICVAMVLLSLWPLSRLGTEFAPELDEGDWMYMPTTGESISIGKTQQILQQTDKLIKSVPEVATVFGKAGRAETATDPAPLNMFETVIQFKPTSEWRKGMTTQKLRQELDQTVNIPGVQNTWVMPIQTRIDMLSTGIKTPLGIKITGPDLEQIQRVGEQIEQLVQPIPGTTSVYAERVVGGRYIVIDINRQQAARYGLNIDQLQDVTRSAIGGQNITETIEGRERYPVNLRYLQQYRDSVDA